MGKNRWKTKTCSKSNHDWLVVWTPLKNMKVNWDDEIPNISGKKKWQPNHQPDEDWELGCIWRSDPIILPVLPTDDDFISHFGRKPYDMALGPNRTMGYRFNRSLPPGPWETKISRDQTGCSLQISKIPKRAAKKESNVRYRVWGTQDSEELPKSKVAMCFTVGCFLK